MPLRLEHLCRKPVPSKVSRTRGGRKLTMLNFLSFALILTTTLNLCLCVEMHFLLLVHVPIQFHRYRLSIDKLVGFIARLTER